MLLGKRFPVASFITATQYSPFVFFFTRIVQVMKASPVCWSLVFFCAAFLVGNASGEPRARLKNEACQKQMYDSDKCIQKLLIFGLDEFKVPRTGEDVKKNYCSTFKKNFDCVVKIKNCLSTFQRTLITLITNNLRRYLGKKLCNTEAIRASAAEGFKCYDQEDMHWLKRVADEITLTFEYATKNASSVVQMLCCAYPVQNQRINKIVNPLCDQKGLKHFGFFDGLHKAAFGETIELICGSKFKTLESCETHFAQGVAEMRDLASKPERDFPKIDYSIIVAAIGLLQTLEHGVVVGS